MSDEEVLICFILVAMHSFLCANSSVTPSYKYFGIFEDLHNAKQYDWCGYILDWLLDCVKTFNRGKCSKDSDGGTLGGCLYYLAVSLVCTFIKKISTFYRLFAVSNVTLIITLFFVYVC